MRTLGGYSLLTRLASGDLSDVFLARTGDTGAASPDIGADEPCVIKLTRADVAADTGYARLLLAESTSATALRHPSIARTFQVTRVGAELFSVHEYVAGQSLSAVLQRASVGSGPTLDPRVLMWIGAEVAAALHLAHETPWAAHAPGGMIHGGLGPRSIMLTYDGQVQVLGLGAGRARLHLPATKTRLPHTAPELLTHKTPDRRVDLFSLGVTIYDACTGRRLFRRATDADTIAAIVHDPVPPVRPQLVPLGESAADLITSMVSRPPETRPATAAEVERVLRAAAGESEASMRSVIAAHLAEAFAEEMQGQRRVVDAAMRRAEASSDFEIAIDAPETPTPAISVADEALTPVRGKSINTDVDSTDSGDQSRLPSQVKAQVARAMAEQPTPHEAQAAHAREHDATVPIPPIGAGDKSRPLPKRIARYQIRELLEVTPGARYFRARDPNVGRRLTLKVIDTSIDIDESGLSASARIALLQSEARLVGKLSHAGLPTLFDAGRDGALYFLSYEYIVGTRLSEQLRGDVPVTIEDARRWLTDVLEALAYLHRRKLVHGDIRAEHVCIDREGSARLMGLSIAAELRDTEHPLRALKTDGLSPEYLHGGGYSLKSDQFALGALLYRILTAERPFAGEDDDAIRAAVVMHHPRTVASVRPDCDALLSDVTMRMLDKDPDQRFASVQEILARLRSGATAVSGGPDGIDVATEHASTLTTAPDTLLVESALPAAALEAVLPGTAVVASVREAISVLPIASVKRIIADRNAVEDREAAQEELRAVAPNVRLELVGPLAARLLGGGIDATSLANMLLGLIRRVDGLNVEPDPLGDLPLDAIRSIARRLELGPADTLHALFAHEARAMAKRVGVSAAPDVIAGWLPLEVQSLFGAVERFWTMPYDAGAPKAALLVQLLAIVDYYYAATTPDDESKRSSPRRTILELRGFAGEGRIDSEIVEALVSHLRDVYSALDVPVLMPPKKKILITGDADELGLFDRLVERGFEVESMTADAMVAWNMLAQGGYDALILGPELGEDDTATLMRLVRSGPRTEMMPVLILGREPGQQIDDEFDHEEGPTSVLPPASTLEAIVTTVSELL